MRPLIGIPPCLDERGRWQPGRNYHYLEASYAAALHEAGADAVVLPDPGDATSLVARLDGLLVPGGDDFLPEGDRGDAYRDVRFDPVSPRQLAFDRALLDAALGRDLPVLGICYGMQLLALAGGGRFDYDLPTDRPDAQPHRLSEEDGRHALEIAVESGLADALAGTRAEVNSLHHQAVADPGRGRAVAWAPDGVIEAIELPEQRFALGVQWHPEKLDAEHRGRLFGAFVRACRER